MEICFSEMVKCLKAQFYFAQMIRREKVFYDPGYQLPGNIKARLRKRNCQATLATLVLILLSCLSRYCCDLKWQVYSVLG